MNRIAQGLRSVRPAFEEDVTDVATLTGLQAQAYKPRRLTVPELEQYIRRGCSCSVCEFARAGISAQQNETSD